MAVRTLSRAHPTMLEKAPSKISAAMVDALRLFHPTIFLFFVPSVHQDVGRHPYADRPKPGCLRRQGVAALLAMHRT